MIISQKLKETNIAEYILYMWQVEDTIRALNFDINQIERIIIRDYEHSWEGKNDLKEWYKQLIRMMIREDIKEKGHLKITIQEIQNLSSLHQTLLQDPANKQYHDLFSKALPFINEFKKKSGAEHAGVIETCMNGLYALLLLRLQKKNINQETKEAMDSFRNLIASLSVLYLNR